MSPPPVFDSAEQALNVLWHSFARLCGLVAWVFIGLLHVVLLLVLALLAWWHHLTPADVMAFGQQMLQSPTVTALGVAGLSGATLGAVWVWLMRRVHRACMSLLPALLLPKPQAG